MNQILAIKGQQKLIEAKKQYFFNAAILINRAICANTEFYQFFSKQDKIKQIMNARMLFCPEKRWNDFTPQAVFGLFNKNKISEVNIMGKNTW